MWTTCLLYTSLAISIGERGRVDLAYMSELLGTPGEYEKIQQELHGVILDVYKRQYIGTS